jgi:hypothetical protein
MSKLQQAFGCGTCASIIPARGNTDPTTARRHEEEQLEKRIEEETGEVKKRKCTPIEYLLLFGKIPELEQVQVMTMGDLTAEDARQLLDAGCSKRHLLRLYGVNTVGGPHYRQLEELLEEQPEKKQSEVTSDASVYEFTWVTPVTAKPKISVNRQNVIRINALAVQAAPSQYQLECKARIGVNKTKNVLAIQPVEQNGYFFKKEKFGALRLSSKQVANFLKDAGIQLPSEFDASWDDSLQAWIGRLI